MDAAQTTPSKKIVFFLALALLLIAPYHAFAQPTLNVSSTTITIGSSSCNDYQNVTVASSDGSSLGFVADIQYPANNPYSTWLYTTVTGSGSTNNSTPFTSNTGPTGVTLTIGLNITIGSASPSATVVLQPLNSSGQATGQPTDITVFYTQNTSCGGNTGSTTNGFISVTPGSISLTAASNGEASQTVTILNNTGSNITFGFSVSPTNTWLTAQANSTTLSANGTASVNVTANANQTTGAGSYAGILTITPQTGFGSQINLNVTFTVTNGTTTGTGGGSGTLSLSCPTGSSCVVDTSSSVTASFNYVAPNTPSGLCIPLQDTASGADYYQTQVSTSNGGNWLYANNSLSTTTTGLIGPNSGACVTLTPTNALSQLASGVYQGQVAITSSSGSTATIYVNLYVSGGAAPGITVSPSLIYVFPNVAANSTVIQEEVFSLTGSSGVVLGTALLSNNTSGFTSTTPVASNNTESFTITSDSAGLIAGIYSTTVTMTSTVNGQTGTTTILLVLPVGQSGSTSTGTGSNNSIVEPLSLAFQQQSGTSFWDSGQEAQAVTITGAAGTQWSASIAYASGSSGWLTFDSPSTGSGTFGSSPATLLVDLFNGVGSLAASSTPYQATVSITTSTGTSTIAVTLLVTPSNEPVLLGLPASATFAVLSTTTGITNKTASIVGSDNTSSTTSPPISAGQPTASWLTVETSGNTLELSVNSANQTTGVYAATVPVTAQAYGTTLQYPVVMIVNGGGGNGGGTTSTGPLTLSASTLTFNNVTIPISQQLSITATNSTTFTAVSSETTCQNSSWLTIPAATYTTPLNLNVEVFPGNIANGTTCNGVITLATSGSNVTQTVNVVMSVGASSSGSGNVTVSPTSMSFNYTQGQTTPAAQTATIVNASSGTASINFTVGVTESSASSTQWLTTNVASASTPYNSPGLSVSVSPGSLSPGTYSGTVTITPNGGTAEPIQVTLTVVGVATVTASVQGASTSNPTTLNLSYNVGGTAPTGTILVSAGGSAANFTATAASSLGWLQISPTSGTTPNTGTFNINVSTVSSALASLSPSATPYTGTVTITGTSPATGTTIINVNLSVTAPLPAITGVTNAASGAVGGVSPGELISIFASSNFPIGPVTPLTLAETCSSPCTSVPKTMGGVKVIINPLNLPAPLLYVSSTQINAIVPYEVAGISALSIEVQYLNQSSNAWPINAVATAPGLFTANGSGQGQIAANQYDTQGNYQNVNLPSAPATAGWTLVLYMTGEGLVSPQPADGSVTVYNANANPSVPVPLVSPHVLINNLPATVTFYGEAPGLVSGVLQLNVLVPANAGAGAVPISVSLGSAATQAGATVSLH